MKRIKLTAILLAFLCFLTACGTSAGSGNAEETVTGEAERTPDAEEPVNEETEQPPINADGHGGDPGGGGRGGMTVANHPEIQAVLDENAGKFEQRTFADPDTADVLEYSLYIPDGYDASAAYPLLMFIPDSTGAGKSAKEIVEQYYGAAVWSPKTTKGNIRLLSWFRRSRKRSWTITGTSPRRWKRRSVCSANFRKRTPLTPAGSIRPGSLWAA